MILPPAPCCVLFDPKPMPIKAVTVDLEPYHCQGLPSVALARRTVALRSWASCCAAGSVHALLDHLLRGSYWKRSSPSPVCYYFLLSLSVLQQGFSLHCSHIVTFNKLLALPRAGSISIFQFPRFCYVALFREMCFHEIRLFNVTIFSSSQYLTDVCAALRWVVPADSHQKPSMRQSCLLPTDVGRHGKSAETCSCCCCCRLQHQACQDKDFQGEGLPHGTFHLPGPWQLLALLPQGRLSGELQPIQTAVKVS